MCQCRLSIIRRVHVIANLTQRCRQFAAASAAVRLSMPSRRQASDPHSEPRFRFDWWRRYCCCGWCCCREQSNKKTSAPTRLDLTRLMPISWKDVAHVTITRRDSTDRRTHRPSVYALARWSVSPCQLSVCLPVCLMLLTLCPCSLTTWKMAPHCNYRRSRLRLNSRLCPASCFLHHHISIAAAAADAHKTCSLQEIQRNYSRRAVFFT